MQYAKPVLLDAVRLFAGIVIYAIATTVVGAGTFLATPGGKLLVAALIAVIYVVVVDIVFGRPTLTALWTVRNATPIEPWPRIAYSTGEVDVKTRLFLKYTIKGSGIVYWFVNRLSRSAGTEVSCELVFDPGAVAEVVIDKGGRNGHHSTDGCSSGGLKSNFKTGLPRVESQTCGFEIVCSEEVDQDQRLGCKLKLHSTRWQWVLRRLVKCDPSIEGFVVGSA